MALDSPDIVILDKKIFQNLFEIFNKIKTFYKIQLNPELILGRWKHQRSQVFFLSNVFSIGKVELVFLHDFKSRRKAVLDFTPNIKNNSSITPGKLELWSCLDLVERLVELSDGPNFMKVKAIFEEPIKKCSDILIASMSQIKPTKGGALFDEIFSSIFAEFFNNYANQSSVINGV
jgi:hypothetical protein